MDHKKTLDRPFKIQNVIIMAHLIIVKVKLRIGHAHNDFNRTNSSPMWGYTVMA